MNAATVDNATEKVVRCLGSMDRSGLDCSGEGRRWSKAGLADDACVVALIGVALECDFVAAPGEAADARD